MLHLNALKFTGKSLWFNLLITLLGSSLFLLRELKYVPLKPLLKNLLGQCGSREVKEGLNNHMEEMEST